MIEAFRRRMALRDARAAVARRSPRPLPPAPTDRTLLVALPPDDETLHDAWELISRIHLPDRRLVLVQTADEIGYTPDRFAGAVRHVGPDARDWRRLPAAKERESVWGREPDLALNLAPPSDLAAALLVGASPAALRVGFHERSHEPFYDLMIRQLPGDSGVAPVERVLRQLAPPIVPFA